MKRIESENKRNQNKIIHRAEAWYCPNLKFTVSRKWINYFSKLNIWNGKVNIKSELCERSPAAEVATVKTLAMNCRKHKEY